MKKCQGAKVLMDVKIGMKGRGRVSPQTRRNCGKCGNRQTMNKSNTEVILSPR